MEQNLLKRSHDEANSTNHQTEEVASSSSLSQEEPERKKQKSTTIIANNDDEDEIDRFVQETKYWYQIISNLDSGPSFYKSFNELEKGLTDRNKILENINQLWHVHRARLILESLELSNPYWPEDWFELTSNNGQLSIDEESLDEDVKLKTKVKPEELGMTSGIAKDLLKEYIVKREDIESHALLLADKLFQKCRVHSVEEIRSMLDEFIDLDEEQNEQNIYHMLCETDGSINTSFIKKWKKYILPQVVKVQNELNMIDDPVFIEHNEKSRVINQALLKRGKEHVEISDDLLLVDIDIKDKEVLEATIEDDESDESDCEIFEEVLYYTYLFNLELPDEKIGSNLLGFLHTDASNNNENVFLNILELVMRMYARGSKALDHQDLAVSELRLGVSLMLLDCLNKELTYLILSQSKEQTYLFYRPLVRAVLDQFIVDYCNPTKYDKHIFCICNDPDVQPFVNILFPEGCPPFSENLTWDVVQSIRGCDKIEYDEKEEGLNAKYSDHPIWANTIDKLKDEYLNHETEGHSKITRKDLEEKMHSTNYTNDGQAVSEPIINQNLISLFASEFNLYDQPYGYELTASNLIENRSIECNYNDDKSLHMDLIRVLRRSGVVSFDEGLLVETYTSLKNYLSLCFQQLEESVQDGIVEVKDIQKITGLLGERSPSFITLDAPFYYKFDDEEKTEAAESYEDVMEEDLDNTEKVPLKEIPLIENDDLKEPEGLRRDIIMALSDEQMGTLCDSFIRTEDGINIGVYTPVIKVRLPSLYADFFDSEEKRKNGLSIGTIEFKVQDDDEKLVFDEQVITKWLTYVYTGKSEIVFKETNSLTIEKLLAKWSVEFESESESETETSQPETQQEEEDSQETSNDGSSVTTDSSYVDEPTRDLIPTEKQPHKEDEEEEDCDFSCENFSELLEDDETKDISLIFNDYKIKVHKYILAMRSPYFKVLLAGNFSDKHIDEYDVSDFLKNSTTLELFVHFLYFDTLQDESFTPEHYQHQNLLDLIDFSQFILSEKLKSDCLEALSQCLDFDQVVSLLTTSFETNREDTFLIAHKLLLKTTFVYLSNATIISEIITMYYQIMSTSITSENVFIKMNYLKELEGLEATLHPFLIKEIQSDLENCYWFIAYRSGSFDKKVIDALPEPVQELISRFLTRDNLI